MKNLHDYAQKQEALYLKFIENALSIQQAIDAANQTAFEDIQAGNTYQSGYGYRPVTTDEKEGAGYYDTRYPTKSYFRDIYPMLEEAGELFIQRIRERFEKEHGHFNVFASIKRDGEKPFQPYRAKEVFDWLEKEKNGISLLEHWRRHHKIHPFQQKGRTLFFDYGYTWDKEEDDGDRVYAPSEYHELYGLLALMESGRTAYRHQFADLIDTVQYMQASTIKTPIELSDSSLFSSIRFYLNGRIDITFLQEDDAKKWMAILGMEPSAHPSF